MLWFELLHCCHSHCNLVVTMVMRCLSVSSYMWVRACCVCMVAFLVIMSFPRLHLVMDMCVSGISVGGGINLVSLICVGVKYAFKIFLKCLCWCFCVVLCKYSNVVFDYC